jgi:hypothetical protein
MYSAGDCSVCAGAGAAVVVAPVGGGDLFFSCPACGCAWSEPPVPYVVDTIDPPVTFAPRGFRLASLDEIRHADLEHRISGEHTASSFCDFDEGSGFVR